MDNEPPDSSKRRKEILDIALSSEDPITTRLVLENSNGSYHLLRDWFSMIYDGEEVSLVYRDHKNPKGAEGAFGVVEGTEFRLGILVGFILRNRGEETIYYYGDLISFKGHYAHC